MAEAVVVARQQHRDTEAPAKHVAHELAGGHGLESRGEGQHLDTVDAGGEDELALLGKRGEHLLVAGGVVEGDAQRPETTATRLGHYLPQHETVTGMDTVEHSYRGNVTRHLT